MELLEGETLRERLEQGALPPRKAVDIAVQIANGLAAAHEKGIVHRDLKPENVFVTKEGRVKILDFGLAKLTQPEGTGSILTQAPTTPPATAAGVVMGTVGYMSPEQVQGRPADHRSDIFSFGAVLYEMLSGNARLPWRHGRRDAARDPQGRSAGAQRGGLEDSRSLGAHRPSLPGEEPGREVPVGARRRLRSRGGVRNVGDGSMQPVDAARVGARGARLVAAVLAVAAAAAGGYAVADPGPQAVDPQDQEDHLSAR